MKKTFMAALMCVAALCANAQDIQLHCDLGKHLYNNEEHTREDVTLTYESFKADGTGSWYYFIDADLDKNGVFGAYTEISREFNVGKQGFAAHLELDAGMNRTSTFQSAALFGGVWNGHNADFSTTYSVQIMYKQFFGKKFDNGYAALYDANCKPYSSFQVTGVWSTRFANEKIAFAGFIDFWLTKKYTGSNKLTVLTEPQLWYNISPKVSFGTEVEISNNFIYNTCENGKTFFINPTLAFKFNL